jgi:serine protease Do
MTQQPFKLQPTLSNYPMKKKCMKFLSFLMCWQFLAFNAFADTSSTESKTTISELPAPSSRAQTLYTEARNDLLQIRVLLKNGRTQSSVGSGFLIGKSNLVVTNYHVVSQMVMFPEIYVGEYMDTNGERGKIKLLAVDALHDLAVISVTRNGTGYFTIPDALPTLSQGQYLYSLGNPLDLGFAISEGAYNGIINRGFYSQIMFTGPINAGMSGGPNITQTGQVAGVNVSKRLDGELVSFLVPVEYVRNILKQVKLPHASTFKSVIGEQLLIHQDAMINALLAQPFTSKQLGVFNVPVKESEQMRCWGNENNNKKESLFDFSSINCAMESSVYVSDHMQVGSLNIRHEYVDAKSLNSLKFAKLQSDSFKNESFGYSKDPDRTPATCQENFVTNGKVPMRAVLCVRAYREFDGLYDFSLLTATTNNSLKSVQSRIDALGVSFKNGLRITRLFLDNIQPTDSSQAISVNQK